MQTIVLFLVFWSTSLFPRSSSFPPLFFLSFFLSSSSLISVFKLTHWTTSSMNLLFAIDTCQQLLFVTLSILSHSHFLTNLTLSSLPTLTTCNFPLFPLSSTIHLHGQLVINCLLLLVLMMVLMNEWTWWFKWKVWRLFHSQDIHIYWRFNS